MSRSRHAATKTYHALARLALALPLAAALTACGEQAEPEPVVRPVRVVSVEAHPAVRAESYAGEVVPRTETQAAFRGGGRMVARLVEVGDRVATGQVLARLDAQDYRLALRAAEAELARAAANEAQARAELERYRPLLERNVASRAQFERVQAAADAARAGLEQARAQVELARNDVGYTELRADADGIVTGLRAEVGQVLAAGQTVLTLAATAERELEIDVPEGRVARLSIGDPAQVQLWTGGGFPIQAQIREISPAADPVTRTYRVRLSLPDAPDTVRLGMTATASLGGSEGAEVITLPATALFHLGEQPAVWVLAESRDRVRLRPVEVAAFLTDGIAIRAGLAPGDQVVVAGVHRLDETLPVRVWDGALP
ncbi:efflux RND transporter periplasmic adaptor subunit [Indioceanicola profundi]|uniref:efflux RND transporter periplasmic adaptor subunit n=1 Tax=Indioceanicola profundi TaxID=2220096 RepID=UPI0013C45AAE|nr:efflux RND transporter periplasmic adaptor subunit [Indioceanicola profundi]